MEMAGKERAGSRRDFHQYRLGRQTWSEPKSIEQRDPDFTVRIFHHKIRAQSQLQCWTYVSEGLQVYAQSEIVFTLLQQDDETADEHPEAPIEWMRVVCQLACQGVHLEIGQPGEITFKEQPQLLVCGRSIPIDEGKWTSMRSFGMLIHGIPLREGIFSDLPSTLPTPRHHVIALTRGEAALVMTLGVTRVMAHVGKSNRWFPYPPWIDRDRSDCCTWADFEQSIRSRLQTVQIHGLAAIRVRNRTILAIPGNEEKREAFRAAILDNPSNKPVAFDSYMPEGAVASEIWRSGDKHPAIFAGQQLGDSPEGNHVSFAFVVLCATREESRSQWIEDGCIVTLKEETWGKAKLAIAKYENLHQHLDDYTIFELRWSESEHVGVPLREAGAPCTHGL